MNLMKPTFLVDLGKCKSNIASMQRKAINNSLVLRPHFKTHQSIEIGRLFRNEGITKITVSSVDMAKYFAKDNWDDITIAVPINPNEIDELNKLKVARLNILVDSTDVLRIITKKLKRELGVFIKIDVGYGRVGINAKDFETIKAVISEIEKNKMLNFEGFLTHAGHTYKAETKDEIKNIYRESIKKLGILKDKYCNENQIISYGDTPSCTLIDDFDVIDEIRPGNFVFYDLMQYNLGIIEFDKIATVLAVPVVSKNKGRCQLTVYGGAVHLSKDYIVKEGKNIFGLIVKITPEGWSLPLENTYVSSISQEHGIIKTDMKFFNEVNIGDFIGIVPVHSCLTANLQKGYRAIKGLNIKNINSEP